MSSRLTDCGIVTYAKKYKACQEISGIIRGIIKVFAHINVGKRFPHAKPQRRKRFYIFLSVLTSLNEDIIILSKQFYFNGIGEIKTLPCGNKFEFRASTALELWNDGFRDHGRVKFIRTHLCG
jgi:hypothetical protein